MRIWLAVIACLGLVAVMPAASARVRVAVDLTSQTMRVDGGGGSYVWPISSARSGFVTPHGSYAPTSLQRMHYSKKYHMSPMPYSIFFRGGYAIHGTYSTAELGQPASHGCIRLAPGNAARLFQMVSAEGAAISISGVPPQGRAIYARARGGSRYAPAAWGYAPQYYDGSDGGWQRDPASGWGGGWGYGAPVGY